MLRWTRVGFVAILAAMMTLAPVAVHSAPDGPEAEDVTLTVAGLMLEVNRTCAAPVAATTAVPDPANQWCYDEFGSYCLGPGPTVVLWEDMVNRLEWCESGECPPDHGPY